MLLDLTDMFYPIVVWTWDIFIVPIAFIAAILISKTTDKGGKIFKDIDTDSLKKMVPFGGWVSFYILYHIAFACGPQVMPKIDNPYNPISPLPFLHYAFLLIWISAFLLLFAKEGRQYRIWKIPMTAITMVYGLLQIGIDIVYCYHTPMHTIRMIVFYAILQWGLIVIYIFCGLYSLVKSKTRISK